MKSRNLFLVLGPCPISEPSQRPDSDPFDDAGNGRQRRSRCGARCAIQLHRLQRQPLTLRRIGHGFKLDLQAVVRLIDPIEGNFFRCLGASTGFLVLNLFKPLRITDLWLDLSKKSRWVIVFASLSGTFLSLLLYLSAVRIGHLATVSGIAITGPLFAGIIECLTQRRWPSRYLIMSFLLFAVGFSILVFYTQ